MNVTRTTLTSPPYEAHVSTGVYRLETRPTRRWYVRAQRWGPDHEKPRICYGDQRWILDDCSEEEAAVRRVRLLDRMATHTDHELLAGLELDAVPRRGDARELPRRVRQAAAVEVHPDLAAFVVDVDVG